MAKFKVGDIIKSSYSSQKGRVAKVIGHTKEEGFFGEILQGDTGEIAEYWAGYSDEYADFEVESGKTYIDWYESDYELCTVANTAIARKMYPNGREVDGKWVIC